MLVGLSKRERQDPATGHLSLPRIMRSRSEKRGGVVCLSRYLSSDEYSNVVS